MIRYNYLALLVLVKVIRIDYLDLGRAHSKTLEKFICIWQFDSMFQTPSSDFTEAQPRLTIYFSLGDITVWGLSMFI